MVVWLNHGTAVNPGTAVNDLLATGNSLLLKQNYTPELALRLEEIL